MNDVLYNSCHPKHERKSDDVCWRVVRGSTIGTLQDADDDKDNDREEQEAKHKAEITRLTHQVISS